jgi:hypothetical protein
MRCKSVPFQSSRPVALTLSLLIAFPLVAQPPGPPPGERAPLPPRPSLAALPIREPIQMDGHLEEEAWKQAEMASDFVQREPVPGLPATEPTFVQVAYTSSTLYIAVRAHAAEAEKIVAEEMQRDAFLFRDDSVILMFDTFNDDRNAYWFETNANGARTDALLTDEGRDFNTQWDAIWDVAARRTPEGWVAEIAIPFTTLRFDPEKDTWGFNVRRLIRYKNEEAFWASIPLEANLFRVSMAGNLTGLQGIEPGLNLRLKPFGVGTATEANTPAGRFSDDDLEAGLDVKWGLTRTMTLDLTYNTDFAEVEVDDQIVNLSRFSVFFPEKREFFLENSGIFEFGFNPPGTPFLKPFFSRQIGIGPFGLVVPIDWGARLTGRQGPWSVGLLDVQTDSLEFLAPSGPGTLPEANWGVVRVKRNIGQRSTLGVIATNREGEGGDFNRVYGLDANLNLTRRFNLSGFFTQSDDPGFQGGEDWAAGARAAWQGPILGWGVDVMQIGDDYNPEAGFLLRSGVRRYVPSFSYLPRPQGSRAVRNYIFGVRSDVVTDLDDDLKTLEISANLFGIRFNTEDQFVLFGDYTEDEVPFNFQIAPGVVIPAGTYEFGEGGVSFATNNSRPLSVNGLIVAGEFYGGDRVTSQATLGWRASRHLRTDTTWVRNDVDLPGGEFTTNVIRQRIGVSITPNLSTNTFLQYNDLSETVSLNLRFNWIYRPGADIFLVFNQNWNAPSFSDLSDRDRAVILKATYLLEI